MAALRTVAATLVGASLGLGGTAVVLYISGGMCSATEFVFSEPLVALTGMPPQHPFGPYEVLSGEMICGSDSPSPLRTWGLLWGPIGIFIGLAGSFAARNSGSVFAGALAGMVVAGVPLAKALHQYLEGILIASRVALKCSVVVLVVLGLGAAIGLIGANVGRRHA
jgi:hypothetical protein